MIEGIRSTGVIEFHNIQKLEPCMFWYPLPSGDESFNAFGFANEQGGISR
jgi:hypothetical protein